MLLPVKVPKLNRLPKWKQHLYSLLLSILCIVVASILSSLYFILVPDNNANIALIFIAALVIISRYSVGYMYGLISSLIAVIYINYQFTYPYFKINFTLSGYPVTFLVLAFVTLMTSTMTSHLTKQAEVIAERERQLADADMEKMRANLLRAISHDLRTPLTGIIGNSQLFLENQKRLSSKEQQDIVSNISEDANWLLNMVENLLTVTRIQGDNFSIATSLEPIEEVVAEAIQRLRKRYPLAQIKVQIPQDFILIPMDAILIEQVTINLLENALVHSESNTPIDFIVTDHPQQVSFTIRDYGVGLPENMPENPFAGSARTKHSSDSRKGMGIGLSICKTIIKAHHGTLIGRNHSRGAEFIFTLPKNQ